MWHFHKWGKVEDGYQYCTVCGKARPVPVQACEHVWETISKEHIVQYGSFGKFPKGINYHLRCKKCGMVSFHESIKD